MEILASISMLAWGVVKREGQVEARADLMMEQGRLRPIVPCWALLPLALGDPYWSSLSQLGWLEVPVS